MSRRSRWARRSWLASLAQAQQLLHRAGEKALFFLLQPAEEMDVIFTGELQHRWSLFSHRVIWFANET